MYLNKEEIAEQMLAEIDNCQHGYDRMKNDSFFSNTFHAQWEMMQELFKEFQAAEDLTALEQQWSAKREQQARDRDREEEHPSFDWYDDHYYYKLYDGYVDGYDAMLWYLRRGLGMIKE